MMYQDICICICQNMLVKRAIFIFPKQQDKVRAIAVLGELDGFPSMNNVWAKAVKYLLRLIQSTANVLLNAAFETVSKETHNWLQGIYHCLTQNGFLNIWFDPPGVNSNFHVGLKHRLNDQYIQSWRSKIHNSSRLTLLKRLETTFDNSVYINRVRTPVCYSHVFLLMWMYIRWYPHCMPYL